MRDRNRNQTQVFSFFHVLFLFGVALCGLFIGNFIGYAWGVLLCGGDMNTMNELLANPQAFPDKRGVMMDLQLINAFAVFIVSPVVYMRWFKQWHFMEESWRRLVGKQRFAFGLVFLLVASYMPVSGFLVQLNESFIFPDSMKGLETQLLEMEGRMKELTLFLTSFEDTGGLIYGMIVIAVLPGIGEELLFRGVLQKQLVKLTGKVHLSIWLTAILFSAFHMQFYGFLPRAALGALFGYLFIWSGNLALPMFAHFLNNGITLLIIYFSGGEGIESGGDMEKEMITPQLVLLSLALSGSVLFVFYKLFANDKYTDIAEDKL